ncbi:uncharacterized protein [Procambarus clarkii]|uniref:uncharacterized protein n=1 Tax=Procambarus clarkii TaxID=6728 RepID=UPI0037444653
MWPNMLLINSKPRHPQTQGSIERVNGDVIKMLGSWMCENQTRDWSAGLPFVQFTKNTAYSRGIGISPYKAVFGIEPPIVMKIRLSPSIYSQLFNNCHYDDNEEEEEDKEDEEKRGKEANDPQYSLSSSPLLHQISSPLPDMEEIIFDEVEEVTVTVSAGATTASTSILSLPQIPPPSLPPILSPPTPSPGIVLSPEVIMNRRLCNLEDGKPNDNNSEVNNDSYNLHIENLGTIRSKVYERQITNASKMLQLSLANVTPVSLYDAVNVIIPKEDRENRTGMRTISGIIIEIDNERDLYRVAKKFGTINQYLSRNDFDKTIKRIMPNEINKN